MDASWGQPGACATLSREVVKGVGRPAWATAVETRPREFYFDGRYFWYRPPDGRPLYLSEDEAPIGGWRHRPDCMCPLCHEAA